MASQAAGNLGIEAEARVCGGDVWNQGFTRVEKRRGAEFGEAGWYSIRARSEMASVEGVVPVVPVSKMKSL